MKTKRTKTTTKTEIVPYKNRTLLTFENPKTLKNLKLGFATAVLHLAPRTISGHNLCPKATDGCSEPCLHFAGVSFHMPAKHKARIERSLFWVQYQERFLERLHKEIRSYAKKAIEAGHTPTFRLNGTSDVPKIAFEMAREFPEFQFSDYTKILASLKRKDKPTNYHLTFSRSESNWKECLEAFQMGFNVSVVVDADITDQELREFLRLDASVKIVDGDEHDATFTHTNGLHLLRLLPKGKMKFDETGMRIRREMIQTKRAIANAKAWAIGL
jgi:hypothetical protein